MLLDEHYLEQLVRPRSAGFDIQNPVGGEVQIGHNGSSVREGTIYLDKVNPPEVVSPQFPDYSLSPAAPVRENTIFAHPDGPVIQSINGKAPAKNGKNREFLTPPPPRVSCDPENRIVTIGDKNDRLSPVEFKIFKYLGIRGQGVSNQELRTKVWGKDEIEESTVKKKIHLLRQKIEPDPRKPRYLLTIPGGYELTLSLNGEEELNSTLPPRVSCDPDKLIVKIGDKKYRLSPIEYKIFEYFFESSPRAVSKEELRRAVRGEKLSDNILRIYIKNLRQKIEPDPRKPRYLLTTPEGYRFTISSKGEVELQSYSIGPYVLYPDTHEVELKDKLIPLTPFEWKLLIVLVYRQGQVAAREELIEKVWGNMYLAEPFDRLQQLVGHLRDKLTPEGLDRNSVIKSIVGQGYTLLFDTYTPDDTMNSGDLEPDKKLQSVILPNSNPSNGILNVADLVQDIQAYSIGPYVLYPGAREAKFRGNPVTLSPSEWESVTALINYQRRVATDGDRFIPFGSIVYDTVAGELPSNNGSTFVLSGKERSLFSALLRKRKQPVPKQSLENEVWADNPDAINLNGLVYQLRSKLKDNGLDPSIIKNIPGFYTLDA